MTGETEKPKSRSEYTAQPLSNTLADTEESYQSIKGKAVPLVSVEALGGIGNSLFRIQEKDILSRYVIPEFSDADFMLPVKGPSMEPRYFAGDTVACRIIKEKAFIQWNRAYVVATRDQGILIKKLKKGPDDTCITAVSENTEYDPFNIPWKDISGIALVIGVIRLE